MSFGLRSFTSARSAPYNVTTFSNEAAIVVPSAPPATDYDAVPFCKSGDCARSQRVLVCYTPSGAKSTVSCVLDRHDEPIVFTNDKRAAVVPAGAIVDSIEFFGIDGFASKDVFSIGLGQLNQDIAFPLIVDSDSSIANERVGGFREISSSNPDGRNEKNLVISNSFVNVELQQPITSGSLQIVIRYHNKLV